MKLGLASLPSDVSYAHTAAGTPRVRERRDHKEAACAAAWGVDGEWVGEWRRARKIDFCAACDANKPSG